MQRIEARAHIPQCFEGVVSLLFLLKVKILNLKAGLLGQKKLGCLTDCHHNSKER